MLDLLGLAGEEDPSDGVGAPHSLPEEATILTVIGRAQCVDTCGGQAIIFLINMGASWSIPSYWGK